MSESTAEQNEVTEEPIQQNDEVVEAEDDTQGEMWKFTVLVVVMLATVLIIALLRPTIFGRIVPAVMGEGQPVAPLVETETEAETIKPEVPEDSDTPVEDSEESEEEMGEAADTEVTEEDAAETEESSESEETEDSDTAVSNTTHEVQAGETLSAIARQYDVTVQEIVSANNIRNPDRVTVGTSLTIPQP